MVPETPAPTTTGLPTVAPLTNVGLTLSALERARNRAQGLPGILVLHGPSGWGKSTAAAYAAVRLRAYYVSMQSVWTRRAFLQALCREMGLPPSGTIAEMAGACAEQLALSDRPLLIDEADVLAHRDGGAGLIKDLYESTLGTVLLIGEETLPQRMTRYERLHGRVLEWVSAQPATLSDARALTNIYCPGVQVADDLLEHFAAKARGSVRRVAVNLDRVRQEAAAQGWERCDRATWGERPVYAGEPPRRRGVVA